MSIYDLALLASQHHSSLYSRQKFGPNGSPVQYVPISLHLPQHYALLLARQLSCLDSQGWSRHSSPNLDVPSLGPSGSSPLSSPHIQHDLLAAIAEPLSSNLSATFPPSLRTSSSHPINISSLLPTELLPVVSSHAFLTSSISSPTILEIPPCFTLHRLLATRDKHCHLLDSVHPPPLPPLPILDRPVEHFRTRSSIADALHAAMNSGFANGQHPELRSFTSTRTETMRKHALKALLSQETVSLSLTLNSKSHVDLTAVKTDISHSIESGGPFSPHSNHTRRSSSLTDVQPPIILQPADDPDILHTPLKDDTHSSLSIGNLFLSSCPGKKVRLHGPVNGRSGVCRDLETDLARIKEMNVGCIICCLDNEELDLLGVSWPTYRKSAEDLGIDVLRIPIPEGLAPAAVSSTDSYLKEIITSYTLQGISVLVHCRGGLGRAGVIACCWAIKLGLCGWLETAPDDVNQTSECQNAIRKDTLEFIDRVINYVRKRRSPKAIETYEQVKFVVDFVEHLRKNAAGEFLKVDAVRCADVPIV